MRVRWLCGLLRQIVGFPPSAQHLRVISMISSIGFIFGDFFVDERQFHQSSPTHRLFLGTEVSSDGRNKSHHHTPLQEENSNTHTDPLKTYFAASGSLFDTTKKIDQQRHQKTNIPYDKNKGKQTITSRNRRKLHKPQVAHNITSRFVEYVTLSHVGVSIKIQMESWMTFSSPNSQIWARRMTNVLHLQRITTAQLQESTGIAMAN